MYCSICEILSFKYLKLLICSLQELDFLSMFLLFHLALFLGTFLNLFTLGLQFIDCLF